MEERILNREGRELSDGELDAIASLSSDEVIHYTGQSLLRERRYLQGMDDEESSHLWLFVTALCSVVRYIREHDKGVVAGAVVRTAHRELEPLRAMFGLKADDCGQSVFDDESEPPISSEDADAILRRFQ
jgi:hypothetical protein